MNKRFLIFLAIALFLVKGDPLAAQNSNLDWTEKIQLYGHGYSVPNDFTDGEYEKLANMFKIFTVEKRHAYNSYGGSPSTERATIGTAAKIKAVNPEVKVLLYWNAVMNYEGLYEYNIEFAAHPEWVHSIWPTGYEIYNLENIDCQNWWVNSVCEIIAEGNLDGVFFDAGPKVNASDLSEAYFAAVDRVRDSIGDDKIILYNGYRVNAENSMQAGPDYIEHHSGVFIEFFLHDPLDTKEEAALLFDNLIDAYEDGKMIVPRSTPSHFLPGAEDPFLFTFASFLLFYGPNSYYLYNQNGYDKNDGMFDYYADYYDIATGQSLGGPQRNGWVYTREFENISVRVDLENKTAYITRNEYVVDAPQNLATSGTASQSSTDYGGEASRAIDGNTNGAYNGASVTHTANEPFPYWQLVLDAEQSINEIVIYGRTDACCADRLSNYTVTVLDRDSSVTFSETYSTVPNPSLRIPTNNIQGQTVKIQSNDTVALSLAEVQLFGGLDTLKLQIRDTQTNSLLSGIGIFCNEKKYLVGNGGAVTLIVSNGPHDFRFEKSGYGTVFKTIDVTNDSTVTVYMDKLAALGFDVYEANSIQGIDAATISIDEAEYTTDSEGHFSMDVLPGTYDYSVSKMGYVTMSRSILVVNDTSLTVQLNKERFHVIFSVKDANTNDIIEGAVLAINDSVYASNELGQCALNLDYGAYTYTINMDGFEENRQEIHLTKDTTVNIVLTPTFNTINTLSALQLKVLPNPVKDILKLDAKLSYNLSYEIYNVQGELILSGTLNANENNLDVRNLLPGVYLIKAYSQIGHQTQRFIKN